MKTILFLLGITMLRVSNARPFAIGFQSSGSQDNSAKAGQDMSAGQTSSSCTSSTTANGKGDMVVKYFEEHTSNHVPYGTCISLRDPNRSVESFQVTSPAGCYTYSDLKCQVSQLPLALPATPLVQVVNIADLGTVAFASFLCKDLSQTPPGQHAGSLPETHPLYHLGKALTPPVAGCETQTHHMGG